MSISYKLATKLYIKLYSCSTNEEIRNNKTNYRFIDKSTLRHTH